ncbi:hypothetical protein PFTANZ_03873 [Plasmodium falciparum Tanzania (2000708)]|uniref:Uncharacterized protein n=1 Tax=Plasmodium falciparum Tanzania (2000708) TaxID=1036725 RepID=A0A024W4L9_PLAFA|nr:hypothetical protein PFTANZ_03873 [Plasmodium falciparum Tanzania (2000708)]
MTDGQLYKYHLKCLIYNLYMINGIMHNSKHKFIICTKNYIFIHIYVIIYIAVAKNEKTKIL